MFLGLPDRLLLRRSDHGLWGKAEGSGAQKTCPKACGKWEMRPSYGNFYKHDEHIWQYIYNITNITIGFWAYPIRPVWLHVPEDELRSWRNEIPLLDRWSFNPSKQSFVVLHIFGTSNIIHKNWTVRRIWSQAWAFHHQTPNRTNESQAL